MALPDKSAIISDDEIITFLKSTPFFSDIDAEKLRELAHQFEMTFVSSGEVLIEQGTIGDCLYLVVTGRLRAIQHKNNTDLILAEMGRSEILGELALITDQPRMATVVAIRDTILLRLSRKSFEDYIQDHSRLILPIVNAAITRIIGKEPLKSTSLKSIVLVPSARNNDFAEFGKAFTRELATQGSLLYLTRQKMDEYLKQAGINADFDNLGSNPKLLYWLNEQEANHKFVVYETEQEYSAWTRQCIRQADRILLVADCRGNPYLNNIEKEILRNPKRHQKKIDLVLLNEKSIDSAATANWLLDRNINEHYHIRHQSVHDLQRLIRILTGQGIALVLGGGGARALAHIGVYKALKELQIPVDIIGGTSFGALLGAFIAMEEPIDVMIAKMKKYIVNNKKIFRYTLPLLALTTGRNLTDSIKEGVGENIYIEDMWKKYFCIVCNLTHGKMEIIEKGKLWKALRATVSIPGFFPPISNDQNDLLIDGGVINNLPVDIMRQFVQGGKIIAVTTSVASSMRAEIQEGAMSGWRVLYQRLTGKKMKHNFPNIREIIFKSLGVASSRHEIRMKLEADCSIEIHTKKYGLFAYAAIDELIRIGYEVTMKKFSQPEIRNQFPTSSSEH